VIRSLFTAIGGLKNHQTMMDVTANNIANVNTVGYKTSQSVFETMLGSANGGSAGLATGVMASAQANIAQQGAEFATSSATDLAINGNGFFCVSSNADSIGQMLFTRAGSFAPDGNGDLRNSAGLYLLGYPLGTDGAPSSSSLGTISLSNIGGKGEETTKASIDANLNASAEGVSGYDAKDSAHNMEGSAVTPDFQTTMNVYDSLGGTQPLKISYVKLDTPANTWAYEVHYDGNADNITPAVNPIATGTMTFNTDGTLKDVSDTTGSTPVDSPDGTVQMSIPWNSASGLASQTVAFNMGTYGKSDGMSQFASDSVLNGSKVDGAIFGNVTGLSVGADGKVTANFSNGLTQAVYQVPLATFANQNGLTLVGGNAFAQSGQSGTPRINPADTAGSGTLQSFALEGSTVDLATEFTSMITTQQAYSASARVVSTASQMMDELMQMQH
jgi:flagellar hook protein FlgE